MTDEQLDELERLEQAATPRPWVEIGVDDAFCASRGGILHASEVDNEWEEQHWIVVDEGPAPANWVPVDNDGFIAAARNALPELIKDLREARAEVARLRAILTPTDPQYTRTGLHPEEPAWTAAPPPDETFQGPPGYVLTPQEQATEDAIEAAEASAPPGGYEWPE